MTHAELVARLPGEDRYLTAILFRPAGAEEFDWLPAGQTVRAGDDVLLYAIDRTDVEQLFALNKEFDRHFYPRQTELNPDESELIRTRLPPRGERVLEVCCGAGRITRHLPRTGNLVVGLDFNLPNLEVAQRRDGGRVRYVLGDATRLPFADASFSVACCLENSLGVLFSLVGFQYNSSAKDWHEETPSLLSNGDARVKGSESGIKKWNEVYGASGTIDKNVAQVPGH